ncbi:MAG: hypothetical protein ACR2LT_01945 [Pyrinomonadaceae bacterium]
MTKQVFLKSLLLAVVSLSILSAGCAVAAKSKDESGGAKAAAQKENPAVLSATKNAPTKGSISFAPDSPADTIRLFYKNLREKRFREALLMTNLRVAVEGLTDTEMQDLNADFEPLAAQVPAELQISGEIITGDKATVTVKLPNDETGVLEDKVFKLQRENGNWIYLMADEATEAAAKKEGKNYFFALRLDVHHAEAQSMIERIAKAEMVYALQNGGLYTDMQTLITQGLLPDDVQNAASTGYHYSLTVAPDKKKYTANAEPAVYGKTGKLSFFIEVDEKGKNSGIKNKDNKGIPFKS